MWHTSQKATSRAPKLRASERGARGEDEEEGEEVEGMIVVVVVGVGVAVQVKMVGAAIGSFVLWAMPTAK